MKTTLKLTPLIVNLPNRIQPPHLGFVKIAWMLISAPILKASSCVEMIISSRSGVRPGHCLNKHISYLDKYTVCNITNK